MRQISDEGRREIAKELREQFYCCQYAEEFTEGLYDVLDLGHCEPTHGGYPDLAERLADYVEPAPVTGSTSDGYHTFDELYHHRAVLFSVIVAMFRGRSWKSLHHHDGSMYDGMFIVGIDTPAGPATYHYDVEPYWDMFPCKVLDRAPEWDGHTPDDAIERIGTLRDILQAETEEEAKMYTCSWCGKPTPNYREYLHPMAGILGESGYSVCDECLRGARIEREWEHEQCAEERLICPYCESSIDDPWYYDEDDEEVVCPECKRTFELEITTVRTYRTKRRIEDMPDGWNGGELQ